MSTRAPGTDAEGVVLRSIRYSEADSVIALFTREHGRVSAIAKGARKPTSKMGGRLQPGVRLRITLAEGRGDLFGIRGAHVLDAHAGLWIDGYRLRAAGCVLETVLRGTGEREPDDEVFALLCRTLDLLARAPSRPTSPRLDPLVLGSQLKFLVVAGIFPLLTRCASCGEGPPFPGFSPRLGGALCPACASAGEPFEPEVADALAGLVGRPLAEAADACPPHAAAGVERVIGHVLHEHLGVTLRSAAPL